MKKDYEDNVLNDLFLAETKKDSLRKLFELDDEEYYFYENETLLIVPKDKKNMTFSISNSEFADHSRDYRQIIEVDMRNASIKFNSVSMGFTHTLIEATFDCSSDSWDVRNNILAKEFPSTLSDSFDSLSRVNSYCRTQKEGFVNIIKAVQNNNGIDQAKVLKK